MSEKKRYCQIIGCEYNKGTSDLDVHFFRIPQKHMEFRQEWEDAIRTLYNLEINYKIIKLCQLHFHPDDIMKRGQKRALKRGTVPTVPIKTFVKIEPDIEPEMESLATMNERTMSDDSSPCVRCLENSIEFQKQGVEFKRLQDKCERLLSENQIIKAQLKYYHEKYVAVDSNQENNVIFEHCDVCRVLSTKNDLREHVCTNQKELCCEYCSRVFKTTIEFNEHFSDINHCKAKAYHCTKCSMIFPTAILLKLHEESSFAHQMLEVVNELDDNPMNKMFECALCNSSFELAEELGGHMRQEHRKRVTTIPVKKTSRKSFECYICKVELSCRIDVKRHLKQHVAARDQKCSICKEMLTSNELNEHVCHSKNSVNCAYCTHSFNATSKLLEHLENAHVDRSLIKCRKCRLYFATVDLRNLHEETHKDELRLFRFICEICSKRYADKQSLKRHMTSHTEQRNFLCSECGSGFKTIEYLNKHRSLHNTEKPFKCEDCPLTFSRQQNYKRHRASHLHLKYTCNDCGKILVSKTSLMHHISRVHRKQQKEKNVECSFCSMKFEDKRRLLIHIRKHTKEKPFQCQLCPDKFYAYEQDLKKHLENIHDQSAIYTCELCKQGFRRMNDMRRHYCVEFKKQTAIAETNMETT